MTDNRKISKAQETNGTFLDNPWIEGESSREI